MQADLNIKRLTFLLSVHFQVCRFDRFDFAHAHLKGKCRQIGRPLTVMYFFIFLLFLHYVFVSLYQVSSDAQSDFWTLFACLSSVLHSG